MGMAPTLWVFDASAVPEVDTRRITELQQVFYVLDLLHERASTVPRPSVRLMRLIELLGRRFSEANAEKSFPTPVWENGVPPQSASIHSAIWAVPLAPNAKETVMSDLVSWARELMLDVYDDELGIYVPADGRPVPYDRSVKFMQVFFHKTARRSWPDAMALRQAVIHGLTLALAPAGFAFTPREGDDACFTRTVPDGVQRVTALVFGSFPAWHCRFFVEHMSHAVNEGLTFVGGEDAPASRKWLAQMGRQLDLLRSDQRPAWHDDPKGSSWATFCMTPFWLEWMLEDLETIALPLLDELATAQGARNVLGGGEHRWYHKSIHNEGLPEDERLRNLVALGAVYLSEGQTQACADLLNQYAYIASLCETQGSKEAATFQRMVLFCGREHV